MGWSGLKACRRDIDMIALFVLVLVFAFASLSAIGTHDVTILTRWLDNADRLGLRDGFAANAQNYPPLASACLWAFHKLFQPFGADQFWSLKLSEVTVLLAAAGVLYAWQRSMLAATLLIAAFMVDSTELAYLDIYFALPLLGALWALKERRYETASFLATIAAAIKWQPLIVAPFVLVYLLKGEAGRFQPRIVLRALWPCVLVVTALVLFYGYDPIANALKSATSDVAVSGNALNLNWLWLAWLETHRPDIMGGLAEGRVTATGTHDPQFAWIYSSGILFLIAYGVTLAVFVLRKAAFREFLLYAGLGYLAYFFLNTGVHENHLFLLVLLFLVLALEDPAYRAAAACAAVMLNINLLLFYGFSGRAGAFDRTLTGIDITIPAALVATLYFLFFWAEEIFVAPIAFREAIAAFPQWLNLPALRRLRP